MPLPLPRHVAIIMDGNGRWAKERGLLRVEGHQQGAVAVEDITEHARTLGVSYLTLYAFSSENWQRPVHETTALMKLLSQFLLSKVEKLRKNGIRLNAIGDLARLPLDVQAELAETISLTSDQSDMVLTLALSYGGRDELVRAAKKIIKSSISAEALTESAFAAALDTHNLPDVDLLIRTSGEERISNFLLWQSAYAELMFVPKQWPAFGKDDLEACLQEFARRERRFGLTSEQIGSDS